MVTYRVSLLFHIKVISMCWMKHLRVKVIRKRPLEEFDANMFQLSEWGLPKSVSIIILVKIAVRFFLVAQQCLHIFSYTFN